MMAVVTGKSKSWESMQAETNDQSTESWDAFVALVNPVSLNVIQVNLCCSKVKITSLMLVWTGILRDSLTH